MQDIQALIDKAKEALEIASYEEARDLLTSAQESLEQLETSDTNEKMVVQATIENCFSDIAWRTGNYKDSKKRAQSAIDLAEKADDKNGLAKGFGNIGIVSWYLSDYPRALEFLQKALAIYEEIKNKAGVGPILGNIGLVYSSLADHSKALEFYQKALEINEEIGNKKGVAVNMGNIGNVYIELFDYLEAIEFHQKALEINEEIGNKNGVAINLGNIGDVYVKLSEFSKAIEYLTRAETISRENDLFRPLTYWLGSLGEVRMKQEQPDYMTSEKALLEALEISRSQGLRREESESLKKLSDLYRLQGNYEKADKYYQQFHEISSEIFSLEAKKQADNFAIQREIQEQEKQQAVEQAAKQARHQATESLLQRVLPAQIADRILDGEEQIADYHASTSILFADIQGFTALTADLPPYMLLQLLHDIFTRFDAFSKTAGCTKIKTIGDGYMVVAGAPETCQDHAERIVQLALQMIEPIELPAALEAFLPEDAELKIRVGIHVGPIVAGVIGQDAFSYDIYSDAVNIASRMESTGEAQRIHVSAGFMRHLLSRFAMTKNTEHGISFKKRGEIEVKGKGTMKTFFLCR